MLDFGVNSQSRRTIARLVGIAGTGWITWNQYQGSCGLERHSLLGEKPNMMSEKIR